MAKFTRRARTLNTEMWVVDVDGLEIGVVGMAVGAPFAVPVA
jgi:hypothetical protein